ncbi:MAG: hypothetical protein A2051_12260 [Desulfovibrionales bacterium GWA2_65_9]|nr:MAG: hypothetical protein A2051_12260 [Desulfovibrionales bacterium GWA2_65_9]
MGNGYFLLWRKSLDALVWQDVKLWRLWSGCSLRASWKERAVLLGRSPIFLRPGDMAVALAEISAGTGLSRKEVRSCLALGKKTGCMEVRGTARGRLIGIVNWQYDQRLDAAAGVHPDLSPDKIRGKLPGNWQAHQRQPTRHYPGGMRARPLWKEERRETGKA